MMRKTLRKYLIFKFIIDNINIINNFDEYKGVLDNSLKEEHKISVVTPNTDILRQAVCNSSLRRAIYNSDYSIIDGIPIVLILKRINRLKVVKLSGSGTFKKLLVDFNNKHLKMLLFGSNIENNKKAVVNLSESYSNLTVRGISPEIATDINEFKKYIPEINEFKPQILVLGLGCPKQELFTNRFKDQIKVNIILNLGATIDFVSGNVNEPPNWSKKVGLAPVFRVMSDPRRLYFRYVSNLKFLFDIMLGMAFYKLYQLNR